MQIPRRGQAGGAEADDEAAPAAGHTDLTRFVLGSESVLRFMRPHQRIFKLASPTKTKITVMIQKRTITFGSAQPLSSK